MLLVITNSVDGTADYVIENIEKRGIDYRRLNSDKLLVSNISYDNAGLSIETDSGILSPTDISTVWLRKPKPPKPSSSVADTQFVQAISKTGEVLLTNLYGCLDMPDG
jgi:hypothetical protein